MSERQPSNTQMGEREKWLHDVKREDAHRAHDRSDAFAQATNVAAIENANLALRYALLINGGAAVAVLGFIGALAGRDHASEAGHISSKLAEAASTLIWFASGVTCAAVAMGFAYLTNYSIAGQATFMEKIREHPWVKHTVVSQRWWWIAFGCHLLAIALLIASIVLFVTGMIAVKDAISHLV